MVNRLKQIRKNAGLTQDAFAEILNITRGYLSQVECGAKVLSDRTVRDVCRIFNVNESWLRSGEGEPYAPKNRNQQIADFVNSAMESGDADFRNELIYGLSCLDQADWEDLARIIRKMLQKKEG